MADKPKGICARLFSRLGGMILALLAAALIYLAAVLLQSPGANRQEGLITEETQPPVTRMQAATMNDARELARMFSYYTIFPGQNTTERKNMLQFFYVSPGRAASRLIEPEGG